MDPPDSPQGSPPTETIEDALSTIKGTTTERMKQSNPKNTLPPEMPQIPREPQLSPRELPKKISKRQQPPAVILELLQQQDLPDRPSISTPQTVPRKILPGRMKGWLPPSPHNFVESSFKGLSPACSYCLKSLGSKGLKCKDCLAKVHTDCSKLIFDDCFPRNQSSTPDPTVGRDHIWKEKSWSKTMFCVACRKKVHQVKTKKPGLKCITCRAICHADCSQSYPRKCAPCVVPQEYVEKDHDHFFLLGNFRGTCRICDSNYGPRNLLAGWTCFWCQMKVCSYKCYSVFNNTPIAPPCPGRKGQQYETLRIPPSCIIVPPGETDPSKWRITDLPESSRPVLAFVNPKSGGQLGLGIVDILSKVVNPLQIIDLTKGGPEPGLKLVAANPHVNFILAACGGDGTAAWVFSVVDKLKMKCPPLAHCPLGTGNDLARCLGWGPGMGDPQEILYFVTKMATKGVPIMLDRYGIRIQEKDATGALVDKDFKVMNNYWSVGIDAKIALKFHESRNANPKQFSNQNINKMWYGKFGAGEMIDGCPGLRKSVSLEIDGKPIKLKKDLEGFIVLNVPSCYGGACLWEAKPKEYHPMRINDELVEVCGLRGSFHLGNVQTGLASPVVLGQGLKVRVTLNEKHPVQLDGEPWIANPGEIIITRLNQATVLCRRDKAHPYVLASKDMLGVVDDKC